MIDDRKYYAVWTNSDRTEGRGQQYVMAYTELEATAIRIGKGEYVQGMDCPITTETFRYIDGKWYAPGPRILGPSKEDRDVEERLEIQRKKKKEKEAAIAKAKALGLSDEEIKALYYV